MKTFRKVHQISKDEFLESLVAWKGQWRTQLQHFIELGGDPNDHDYARLSFLTRELRKRGWPIISSKQKGLMLP